ncbi:MAG: CRTAC1 family protein [Planctomycetes bacterium]|nr:CRTAC1 family protein [Planctomycetota bacterium]
MRTLILAAIAVAMASVGLAAQNFQQLSAPLGITSVQHTFGVGTGTGVCIADFDGDGDVDVVLPQQFGLPMLYFRNDGGMVFVDATATAGLGGCEFVRCVNAADIDNDGDQDLFVGNENTPPKLFVNDGTGSFTEEAQLRGVYHNESNHAAAFGDYDRDGWLDLYIGIRTDPASNWPAPNYLFRNTGGGHFVDVTAAAGLAQNRPTLAATFMDYDEDGWPDVFVANDKGPSWGPNELYRNNGDGTFTDVSVATGTNIAIDGMSIDFVDVFNDGGVDFYCTDVPADHLFQLWDPVTGAYLDATATYGLQGGAVGWASNWLDYDNDGWQDLHVVHSNAPNAVFHNPGTPHAAQTPWPNVAFALGLGQIHNQHTAVTVDLDDDGRVDLVQRYETSGLTAPQGVSVHHNQVPGGNWIKFRTRGVTSNRDGIGARIEVDAGGLNQRQWVRSGVGFLSCADRRVHFGLGASPTIDRVTITWPSGQRQFLSDVPANQIVELVEPHMSAAGTAPVGGSSTISASLQGDEGLPYLLLMSFSTANGIALPSGDVFPLDHDALLSLTLDPSNPILVGSVGTVPANGEATATLHVPPLPLLSGLTCYSAALTTDVPSFPVVRTVVAKPIAIQIQ